MDGGRAHWMTLPNWVIHLKYNLYYIICYILYRTIHIYIYIYKDIPSPNDMLRHLGPFMVEENHQRVTSTRCIRKNPICLFVKISYKLVPISKGQADLDLLLNNKSKLVSLQVEGKLI